MPLFIRHRNVSVQTYLQFFWCSVWYDWLGVFAVSAVFQSFNNMMWEAAYLIFFKILLFLRFIREYFLIIWSHHHYRWRVVNFYLHPALMDIKQLGFFSAPHLLWHGNSVYMVVSEDTWHTHLLLSVWQWSCQDLILTTKFSCDRRLNTNFPQNFEANVLPAASPLVKGTKQIQMHSRSLVLTSLSEFQEIQIRKAMFSTHI